MFGTPVENASAGKATDEGTAESIGNATGFNDTHLHISNFMGHTNLSMYLISHKDADPLKTNKKGLTAVELLFLWNDCDKGAVDFDHVTAVCQAMKENEIGYNGLNRKRGSP